MKIYVGNLSETTTGDELRELFVKHGTVEDVYLVTEKGTERSRGFGFVMMPSIRQGRAAIEALRGHELEGKRLTVSEAKTKTKEAPTTSRPFGRGARAGLGGRSRRVPNRRPRE